MRIITDGNITASEKKLKEKTICGNKKCEKIEESVKKALKETEKLKRMFSAQNVFCTECFLHRETAKSPAVP